MARRAFFAGILMLTLAAPTGVAWADPPPEDAAVLARARQNHAEGVALYQQGRFAEARAALLAAWGIKKHWSIASSLGDCAHELKNVREAAQFYAYASADNDTSAEVRPVIDKRLAEAKRSLGEITVVVDTDDAELKLDGQPAGRSPLALPLYVEPGRHTLEARLAGRGISSSFNATAGSPDRVSLTLPRAAGEAPPAVPAGPAVPPDTGTDRSIAPLLVAGGIAVAGIGAGITLLALANGKSSDADTIKSGLPSHACGGMRTSFAAQCEELDELASSQSDMRTGGGIALGIGGIAAAAGLTYWFWPKSEPAGATGSATRPTASFFVGPRGSGVSVRGAF